MYSLALSFLPLSLSCCIARDVVASDAAASDADAAKRIKLVGSGACLQVNLLALCLLLFFLHLSLHSQCTSFSFSLSLSLHACFSLTLHEHTKKLSLTSLTLNQKRNWNATHAALFFLSYVSLFLSFSLLHRASCSGTQREGERRVPSHLMSGPIRHSVIYRGGQRRMLAAAAAAAAAGPMHLVHSISPSATSCLSSFLLSLLFVACFLFLVSFSFILSCAYVQ